VTSNGEAAIGVFAGAPLEVPYEETASAPNLGEGNMMRIITGKSAPFIIATYTDNLIFFLLPFIVFISAADFKNGTVKNLLSSGTNRVKYYFAKLIMITGASIFLILLNLFVTIITATIKNGFKGSFNIAWLSQIAEIYLPQLYLLFVFGCIGVFFIFIFKNTAALNTIYIAYSFLPVIIISILLSFSEKFEFLPEYDLVLNMKSFAYSSEMDIVNFMAPNLTRTLILGGVYIIACTIGGIALFRKSEVK
jgi:ABC-type transport system involved in multi-copper enzyme maturation permease subunit